MKRLLKYFFYKLYSYSLSQGQNNFASAERIVNLFILLNIISIINLFLILTKIKLTELPLDTLFISAGLILFGSYFIFLNIYNPTPILNEFRKPEAKTKYYNWYLVLYIISSIFVFFYTVQTVKALNGH
jgi:hypothetical protein